MKDFYAIMLLALFVLLLIALLWRTVNAPSACDRLIAGSLAANVVTFVLLMSGIISDSELYLDAALAAALLSFSGTIIIARWITAGRLM